ncbi:unnamed protein product [Adineta steineri]|uniref:G-protein coupled receptors family 1 profile domain-containing protein n=1 Tax=Adineta steineri TaxID=433720 RepID=A0A813NM93_9BILA|nr:unnamed protein product [Adineta steineri]CAF4036614.1 unnamed protein product [Adineta steineri]
MKVLLSILQGPIRVYYYYNNGCLPAPNTSLCDLSVYLDYIPTQINNFLIVQMSIERFLLVVKPFIFHRRRHQYCSFTIFLHYTGLFMAIVFPSLYYPIIIKTGAATTINLDSSLGIETCDLWYTINIYETFDLFITSVPYFLILFISLSLIGVVSYRKYVRGIHQTRQTRSRSQRRILFSLKIFLIWFLLTWSPWVLYDFFQTILNMTYSVYIDAITTFIVYLDYTFTSTIVLITLKEMRQFWLDKLGLRHVISKVQNRVVPNDAANVNQPIRHAQTRLPVVIN